MFLAKDDDDAADGYAATDGANVIQLQIAMQHLNFTARGVVQRRSCRVVEWSGVSEREREREGGRDGGGRREREREIKREREREREKER